MKRYVVLMSTLNIPIFYGSKISLNYLHMFPDQALRLTLSGSNDPCLEQISMVSRMCEPLKFDCIPAIRLVVWETNITWPHMKQDGQNGPLSLIWVPDKFDLSVWEKQFKLHFQMTAVLNFLDFWSISNFFPWTKRPIGWKLSRKYRGGNLVGSIGVTCK